MPQKPLVPKQFKHYGDVGAGRVIPFIPRDVTTTVYVPESMEEEDGGTVTVRGHSLEDANIFDGDTLIFSRKFTKQHITPHAVCVLWVKSAAELMAKKVLFDTPGYLRLRSSKEGVKDLLYESEDVEIWGVGIGIQRMWGLGGRIPAKFDPDIPF